MKIKFDKYTYYQDDDDVQVYDATKDLDLAKKYEYSPDHFNELLRNRQYDDAIAYASKYVPNNPKDRRSFEEQLNVIKNQGRKITALYSRLDKDRELPLVEFFDNVFTDGGLERLNNNNYADSFIYAKQFLGSKYKGENNPFSVIPEMEDEADGLQVRFQPKSQSLFGIDKLKRDNNDFNIDKFYELSGLTEGELIGNGVQVVHKDGETILQFRKDNALANSIIYNVGELVDKGSSWIDTVFGRKPMHQPVIEGTKTLNGQTTIVSTATNRDLQAITNLVNNAKDEKNRAMEVNNLVEKDYSGFQAGYVNDELEQLRAYAEANPDAMTESEFNKEWSRLGGDAILTAVKTFGGRQAIYSNLGAEAEGDRTMVKKEGKERNEVIDAISRAKKTDLTFTYGCVNGIVGTVVTINGQNRTNQTPATPRVQVFLPGFMSKEAQAAIQRNSLTRAAKELNDMQDWGYTYDCEDGTELVYTGTDANGSGQFMDIKTKQRYDKTEAAKILNKDMSIRDAKRQLKFNHMNVDGELIDIQGYDRDAQYWALQLAEELDPGLPIYDFTGKVYDFTKPEDISSIFNHDIDENNMQFDSYYKLQNIYDIYNKIMEAISNY